MAQDKEIKVAFVHDFLVSYGGAERVLESLIRLYPEAPIYTLLYDAEAMGGRFAGKDIRVSFLAKLPAFLRRRHRWLLPIFPVAVEAFDLRDFDLVISSSGAWSKGVVTRLHTVHVAYLHSPMRLLWDANERYLDMIRAGWCKRFFGRIVLSYLRLWDREAADRPDVIVSNSRYTALRAEKYYRRESPVVYPPVVVSGTEETSTGRQVVTEKEKFFLVVARLSESKGIGTAIEAFNKLGLRLVVVGEGRERRRLEAIAEKNISFTGRVDDTELTSLYRRAESLIMPSEEDFGMVAAEAIALGTPVIALGRGGALEIVEPGATGELFRSETPEVLADAVRRFLDRGRSAYEPSCRERSGRFSEERFLSEWRSIIEKAMREK
mgnify:CR=1 FL=1